MKLQALIQESDLDMTDIQVKAFFLGVLSAEKPMPFAKTAEELLSDVTEGKEALVPELQALWNDLQKNTKVELGKMLPANDKVREFLETARDQLDYFLTAMSLSGTNPDSCKDEELQELMEVLEENIAEMDEFVSDDKSDSEAGEELKEILLETWEEFVSTKN